MPKPSSFREVVELWGKRETMAEDLGVPSNLVSKWWQRDRIPAGWWPLVVASPIAKVSGVSLALLADFAALDLEERRA